MTHFLLWQLGLARAETQTSDAERECLAKYAAGKKRLVEIGVWHGVTTCVLRKAMAPDGLLLGVDPYPIGRLGFSAQRRIGHREAAKIRNGNMQWLRMTGGDAGRHYATSGAPPVDFIFIDGDHSYDALREDWGEWSPLVAPGGIVALHDSCPTPTKPIENAGSVIFTREVILSDSRFTNVETVDTLTVLQREGPA